MRLCAIGLLSALIACSAPRATSAPPARPQPAASTQAPLAADSPLFAYETVRLAEGVYAFVARDPGDSMLVTGNSLLVAGDDGALFVDTGHFPSLARRMIDDVRRLTKQPVRYVVTTHWHPDHLFGNTAFRDAFPGVVFLAHAETRRLALLRDPEYVNHQRDSVAILERLRETLRTGTRKGQPLTAEDRRVADATARAVEQTLGDADVELVPPSQTFTDEVTVHLGRREVRVMHLGRGNTAGDVVVHIPDAGVLATGDLVVLPTPYAYDAYPSEWVATLKKMTALGATTLVPGHGPIQRDTRYVDTLVGVIESVREQVGAAVAQGLSLDETRRRVDLEKWRRAFAAGDPSLELAFRVSFEEPFVERAYQEARGQLAPE